MFPNMLWHPPRRRGGPVSFAAGCRQSFGPDCTARTHAAKRLDHNTLLALLVTPGHGPSNPVLLREVLLNCLAAGEPYIAYGIHTLALYQASFLQSGNMARYCAPFTTDLIGYLPSTRSTPSIEKCLSIDRQDATTRSLSLDSASLVCSS